MTDIDGSISIATLQKQSAAAKANLGKAEDKERIAQEKAEEAEAAPGNGAETLIEQQRKGELRVEGRRGGG